MTIMQADNEPYKKNQINGQEKLKPLRRLEGLAVPAVVGLMLLSAYLVFKLGLVPTHTVNKGSLVSPPFNVKALNLMASVDGQKINWDEKKWRILIPAASTCDAECFDVLYKTRQVHKLLAGKAHRVERILFLAEGEVAESYASVLAKDYPKLLPMHGDYSEFKNLLSASGVTNNPIESQRYFIVDQEGFLMMSYTSEHSGQDLLTDLKRLLKYSYEK